MNRSINWPGQTGAVSRSDPKVRERTLRLFQRQTRGLTAWSDGSSLHEGRACASCARRRLLWRALRRVSPDRSRRTGLPVPAGTPVRLDLDGTARLAVSGLEHFPAGGLKVSDLRRDRTQTLPEHPRT